MISTLVRVSVMWPPGWSTVEIGAHLCERVYLSRSGPGSSWLFVGCLCFSHVPPLVGGFDWGWLF
jgi:hypothetical protein